MGKLILCKCECHVYHLTECGECLDNHHSQERTFTDSYIADMISEYFHRYAMPNARLGTFYYEMIFSDMVSGKVTEISSSKISYLNYLFKHKRQTKVFKLIHRGIMQFLSRNGKGDITRDFDKMGKLQWRLVE